MFSFGSFFSELASCKIVDFKNFLEQFFPSISFSQSYFIQFSMYKRGNPRGHPAEVPIEVFLAFRIVLVTNRHLNFAEASKNLSFHFCTMLVVGLSGLEPPTSRLSGVRSNRLSYKPISRLSGSHRSAHSLFAATPLPFGSPTFLPSNRLDSGSRVSSAGPT